MSSWSLRTWIALISLALTVAFLYAVRTVLTPFCIALLLLYLLNPAVAWLSERGIRGRRLPRVAAVILVMGLLLGSLVALISYLVPAVAQEVKPFRETVITYYHQIADQHLPALVRWLQTSADQADIRIDVRQSIDDAFQDFLPSNLDGASIVVEIQHLIGGLFSAIVGFLLVFIMTLFLLLDWPRLHAGFWQLIPPARRSVVKELIDSLDRDLSGSIRGQLTICLINFILTTIGLALLQVKYAIILGLIAGAFSIVPVFGSIVSTIPIVLVSLTVSFLTAVKAVIVIIVIHLIEANALNPKVMGHHVELHPVVILFAIVVADHLLGPVGLLAGVPIAASLRSILRFAFRRLVPVPVTSPPTPVADDADVVLEPGGPEPISPVEKNFSQM